MSSIVYQKVKAFKRRYPLTIAWRLRANCKVIEKHLNPGEVVKYAFAAQKNDNFLDIFSTNIFVMTNKRILIGTKRVVFGYFFNVITPDMFNDLTVKMGIIWGKVYIDTIKEFVCMSNIQKGALPEIETFVTEYLMTEKKKYAKNGSKEPKEV